MAAAATGREYRSRSTPVGSDRRRRRRDRVVSLSPPTLCYCTYSHFAGAPLRIFYAAGGYVHPVARAEKKKKKSNTPYAVCRFFERSWFCVRFVFLPFFPHSKKRDLPGIRSYYRRRRRAHAGLGLRVLSARVARTRAYFTLGECNNSTYKCT